MDVISSLPDPILCHILSFLQIKFSATTSVLARRWRFLWTYVRVLHFHRKQYLGSQPQPENKMRFSDMIYRVLLQHNGPIDSLIIWGSCESCDTIISSPCLSQYQMDAWISTAIARNVQVLNLSVCYKVRLPQCCLKCETLVELIMEDITISAKPGAVCLPKLKKLTLFCNSYEDDESLPNLISGCSAIENLVIDRNEDGCLIGRCYICSPTLKSLVLTSLVTCNLLNHEHKLVLDVPAVQYLQLHDDISHIIQAENLSSLVAADIWFSKDFHAEDDGEEEEDVNNWRDMFRFVEKLSTAKSLTLKSSARMNLLDPAFSIATTRFRNMTKLIFEADWQILTELLENADKLESLTIRKVEDELKCWRKPKHLPKCLLSSLKYVNIRGFKGGEHELNMVRYILRHAKVLKKMNIYAVSYGYDSYSKLKMLQQISYFPRVSHKCRLTFD